MDGRSRRRGRVSRYEAGFPGRVLELAAAGATLTDIARSFQISRRTLERWADEHASFGEALAVAAEGVGRGRPARFQPHLASRVVELGAAGMKREDIAKTIGIAPAVMERWAQEHPRFAAALQRVDALAAEGQMI